MSCNSLFNSSFRWFGITAFLSSKMYQEKLSKEALTHIGQKIPIGLLEILQFLYLTKHDDFDHGDKKRL
jgi:hypothetical protein